MGHGIHVGYGIHVGHGACVGRGTHVDCCIPCSDTQAILPYRYIGIPLIAIRKLSHINKNLRAIEFHPHMSWTGNPKQGGGGGLYSTI